jgi:hypothetical protein
MTNYNNPDPRNRGVYGNPGDRSLNPQVDPANYPANAQIPVQNQPVNQPVQPTTYQDGYHQGRDAERYRAERYNEELRNAEGNGAATGLMTGLLLAALAGLGLGAYLFFNEQNRPRTVVPSVVSPSPASSPSPQIQERIIERDRLVPVPQPVAPPPDVNITVPSAPQAPSAQTAPSQPAPSNTAPADTTGEGTGQTGGSSQ